MTADLHEFRVAASRWLDDFHWGSELDFVKATKAEPLIREALVLLFGEGADLSEARDAVMPSAEVLEQHLADEGCCQVIAEAYRTLRARYQDALTVRSETHRTTEGE